MEANQNLSFRRLLFFYFLLFLLCAIGLGYNYLRLLNLRSLPEEILTQHKLIEKYGRDIDADVNYMAYSNLNHLLSQRAFLRNRADGLWNNQIKQNLDSLANLGQLKKNTRSQELINSLRKNLIRLDLQWRKILKTWDPQDMDLLDSELDKDFDLLLVRIRSQIKQIVNEEESEVQFKLYEINQQIRQTGIFTSLLVLFAFLSGFLLTYFYVYKLFGETNRITRYLKELISGSLPRPLNSARPELMDLAETGNEFNYTFQRLSHLAEDVSKGTFDSQVRVFQDQGVLGEALSRMRASLQNIARGNRERNWLNEGYAKFAEILRASYPSTQVFYEEIIRNLVDYLEINQGGIFTLNETPEQEASMELQAAYAYNRQKFLSRSIYKEEGLVGQAWREQDLLYITDIPEDYADITSGLGHARPKALLLAPLVTNYEVMGVLELASLQDIPEYKHQFINRVGESIATTIARLKIDDDTKRLLEESQTMAYRMKEQEEEMKQNMEELMTTKEIMEQNTIEINAQIDAISRCFLMLETDTTGNITKVNPLFLDISGYREEEILNRHYSVFYGEDALDDGRQEDWNRVIQGKTIVGDFVRYQKNGDKFWIHEVMYPLVNTQGDVYKICLIGHDISKQKEQEREIKSQLNELYMSKRDVVNRIREVEGKARGKIMKLTLEYQEQLKEKERIIEELRR